MCSVKNQASSKLKSEEGGHSSNKKVEGGHSSNKSEEGGHSSNKSEEGGHSSNKKAECGHSSKKSAEGGHSSNKKAEGGHSSKKSAEGGHSSNKSEEGGHSSNESEDSWDSYKWSSEDDDDSDFCLKGRSPRKQQPVMPELTKEQRYEKLKFLLDKSTMFTNYLMARISKQKEEGEQKIRERLLKLTQIQGEGGQTGEEGEQNFRERLLKLTQIQGEGGQTGEEGEQKFRERLLKLTQIQGEGGQTGEEGEQKFRERLLKLTQIQGEGGQTGEEGEQKFRERLLKLTQIQGEGGQTGEEGLEKFRERLLKLTQTQGQTGEEGEEKIRERLLTQTQGEGGQTGEEGLEKFRERLLKQTQGQGGQRVEEGEEKIRERLLKLTQGEGGQRVEEGEEKIRERLLKLTQTQREGEQTGEEGEEKIRERLLKLTQGQGGQRDEKDSKLTQGEGGQRKEEDGKLASTDSWQHTKLMEESCDSKTPTQSETPAMGLNHLGSLKEEDSETCVISADGEQSFQPRLLDGGVLRPYQVDGYNWLKVHYENGVNGILADEMGLGKTVQCVAIIAHLMFMGISGPFLVCAPLSTLPHWSSEFTRFAPKVPTVLYHGPKDIRSQLLKKIQHRHQIREGVLVQPVVITSYEIAMVDSNHLANHAWKYLIMDEGHRIKNAHCRLIKELRMYQSAHRLLLTGTPLQNSLAELWTLLNFLLPGIFDDLGSFEAWFDVRNISDGQADEQIIQQERAQNILAMLHQILTPFMLRRLKSDVDIDIPPKKEVLVFAPMTQHQTDFYSAVIDGTIFSKVHQKHAEAEKVEITASGRPKRKSASKSVDYRLLMETDQEKKLNRSQRSRPLKRRWEEEDQDLEDWAQALSEQEKKSRAGQQEEHQQRTSQVTIKMQNVMMELCKCCNHPYLLEHPLDPETGELAVTEEVITASGKMLVLDKMLVELKKRGHKVLIFSQMTRMLDLIEDFCNIRNYDFCRIDGSTHVDSRSNSVTDFQAIKSDKFLFLLSTKAGGLGINLPAADTVIIYDSAWNPQCDIQAQDRCHRIGQRKPVVVYRFVTAHTIDQKIIERAAAKRKLEKMIIHKGKFKTGNLLSQTKPISPEELQDLLQSKDHQSEVKGDAFTISQKEMNSLLDRSDLLDKWRRMKEARKDQKKDAGTLRMSPCDPKPAAWRVSSRNRKPLQTSQPGHQLFKVLETEDADSSSGVSK